MLTMKKIMEVGNLKDVRFGFIYLAVKKIIVDKKLYFHIHDYAVNSFRNINYKIIP